MLFHAEIIAQNEEGVLERILRVCRHRGFGPQSFSAVMSPLDNLVHIEIEGVSERPHQLLATQIQKLYEVLSVTVDRREALVMGSSVETRVRPAQVRRTVYANSSHG